MIALYNTWGKVGFPYLVTNIHRLAQPIASGNKRYKHIGMPIVYYFSTIFLQQRSESIVYTMFQILLDMLSKCNE